MQLIVGGGATSLCGEVTPLMISALSRALTEKDLPIVTHLDMGYDGVTAANLFDTIGAEEGRGAAVLAPGAAIMASLSGDTRVHFDYSRWAAMIVAQSPVVTVARADLEHTFRSRLRGLVSNRPLSLAVSRATGVEMTSLLGMKLLGMRPIPLSGFGTQQSALRALREGHVDAVQLTHGSEGDIAQDIAKLPSGVRPIFYSGPPVVGVPSLSTAYAMVSGHLPSGPLYKAWLAVADAAATAFVLALPMLTPPLTVARWHHAARQAIVSEEIKNWSALHNLSLSASTDAASLLNKLTPELTALLGLRRWINTEEPKWRHEQSAHLK